MKNFTAVRKPIYITTVEGKNKDFCFAHQLFDKFVETHPEYKEYEYDSEYNIISGEGIWKLSLYRECAVDFVEE